MHVGGLHVHVGFGPNMYCKKLDSAAKIHCIITMDIESCFHQIISLADRLHTALSF